MARNDGIDRTVARNQDIETADDLAKVQEHNEREKDSYSNQDIVPDRSSLNIHFKEPTAGYEEMFTQMEQDKVISTRGLKADAVKYGELVFDVNSAYFYNHGGYEFAKEFYADAYKAAVEIVGGEQYILSACLLYTSVPEDIGIVPAIVKGYILACFLAVLVCHIEWLLIADSTDNFQIFFRKGKIAVVFLGKFVDRILGIVVQPSH